MSEPFVGEIKAVGLNFSPRGWAYCNGQLLPISQYQELFSLLGTTYGGDGITTFALPDLRGRTPIHFGTGPGLSTRRLGERNGVEYNILNTSQIPSHTHTASLSNFSATPHCNSDLGTTNTPEGNYLAQGEVKSGKQAVGNANIYSDTGTQAMAPATVTGNVDIGNTGGGQPINNMQPYLAVNYVIALAGLFPSRS